jgi:hypothetical protein
MARTQEQKTAITQEYLIRFIYWVDRLDVDELRALRAEVAKLGQLDTSDATKDFVVSSSIYINSVVKEKLEEENQLAIWEV